MSERQKYVALLLSADPSRELWMMAGRSKSIGPAQMAPETQTLFSMVLRAVQLGRWVTRNSSLIRCQKKVVPALEELASELSEKLAEGLGVEKAGRESTRTRSKRKSSGKP